MIEANATVLCCHNCTTRVKVLERYSKITLVQRASDGELFVVPADTVTPDQES